MTRAAFVAGAGGAVGEVITHSLLADGWRVVASMRSPRPEVRGRLQHAGAQVVTHDLTADRGWTRFLPDVSLLVFSTHLRLTRDAFQAANLQLSPDTRLVAFSSNNVAIHPHAQTYRDLASSEAWLHQRCSNLAIVRPTLIYGDPRLPTVTRLLRLAARSPVVPLPGSGRARVQPVFHEDLARAVATLANSKGPGVYAVGGPEIVTMQALFEHLVSAMHSRARVVCVPQSVLSFAAPVLSRLGLVTPDQIERVDYDRVAVVQAPLPAAAAPRVSLEEGLARHAAALRKWDAPSVRA